LKRIFSFLPPSFRASGEQTKQQTKREKEGEKAKRGNQQHTTHTQPTRNVEEVLSTHLDTVSL